MVIWLTGMSGAGKTTIAEAMVAMLKPSIPELVLVDGDVIRELFGASLGYEEPARREQIGRIQRLSGWLSRQGQTVIVAALYAHPDLLAWNRENLPGYFEVYVDAPLTLLRERDSKGLYAGADSGRTPNVVGIDIPWHAPQQPDMVIDASRVEPPQELALRIARRIPEFTRMLDRETA
ncbi:MAG: adenylyl-sulfate kinase [Alphaproteobacteria bacterium]|jgi:adenylylsulfate kinase-like enzyme